MRERCIEVLTRFGAANARVSASVSAIVYAVARTPAAAACFGTDEMIHALATARAPGTAASWFASALCSLARFGRSESVDVRVATAEVVHAVLDVAGTLAGRRTASPMHPLDPSAVAILRLCYCIAQTEPGKRLLNNPLTRDRLNGVAALLASQNDHRGAAWWVATVRALTVHDPVDLTVGDVWLTADVRDAVVALVPIVLCNEVAVGAVSGCISALHLRAQRMARACSNPTAAVAVMSVVHCRAVADAVLELWLHTKDPTKLAFATRTVIAFAVPSLKGAPCQSVILPAAAVAAAFTRTAHVAKRNSAAHRQVLTILSMVAHNRACDAAALGTAALRDALVLLAPPAISSSSSSSSSSLEPLAAAAASEDGASGAARTSDVAAPWVLALNNIVKRLDARAREVFATAAVRDALIRASDDAATPPIWWCQLVEALARCDAAGGFVDASLAAAVLRLEPRKDAAKLLPHLKPAVAECVAVQQWCRARCALARVAPGDSLVTIET